MPTLVPYTPNMSGKRPPQDPRVKKAAALINCFAGLKVPEAMQAAQFSNVKSQQPTLQMQVRRLSKKTTNTLSSSTQHPPSSINLTDVSPLSFLSSSTNETAGIITKNASPNPSMKKIRKTSSQKQQLCIKEKQDQIKYSMAHKQATRLYAIKKEKPGGLSARKVSDAIFNDTGICISE